MRIDFLSVFHILCMPKNQSIAYERSLIELKDVKLFNWTLTMISDKRFNNSKIFWSLK